MCLSVHFQRERERRKTEREKKERAETGFWITVFPYPNFPIGISRPLVPVDVFSGRLVA